jgi:simple sugar transport system permease protein
VIAIPAVLIGGAVFGALWIIVPAIVRSKLGTSEIVTTLLLTYVAQNLMNYFIYTESSYFRDPSTSGFPQGRRLPAAATLDAFGSTRIYPTFFVALAVAIVLFWIVKKTEYGYRIQVLADSPRAAQYAGINAARTTLSVMMISGALAGLAGATLLAGPFGKLDISVTALGYGYAGIVVAALARYNFIAIIGTAILFAGLRTGGAKLQISSDTPIHIGVMLQGAILLFALGGEIFRRYRLRVVRQQQAVAS